MRLNRILLLTALALMLTGSLARAAEITWGDSFDSALSAARKTGKPILIDFYADWCGWCKKLDKDVYTDATVVKTSKQFINVKLDTERNGREAARRFGVRNLPTVLIVDGNGDVELRISGYMAAPRFNSALTEAAQAHKRMPGLLTRYRSNDSDLEAASELTQIYARRGNEDQAQRSLARVAKLDPNDTRGKYAKCLNRVADMYFSRNNYDEAIPLFRRSVKSARGVQELGYSQLSLAVCQIFLRNLDGAYVELKAALANPRISARDKGEARRMMEQLDTVAKQPRG